MTQNMSTPHRAFYAVVGAALLALPWIATVGFPWNLLAPAMGIVSLVSAGAGV